MQMLEFLIDFLEQIATKVSIEVFVIAGSLLEDLFPPIPSPFVMATAFVLAQEQGYSIFQYSLLIFAGAIFKTFSSGLIYVAADKAEDIILGKFGKYIGVQHATVVKMSKFLNGTWWDDVLFFITRAIPIFPTFPISVLAGVVQYSWKNYLVITFLGTAVRNGIYLWIAFFGYNQLKNIWFDLQGHPLLLVLIMLGVVGVGVVMKYKDQLFDKLLHHHAAQTDKE